MIAASADKLLSNAVTYFREEYPDMGITEFSADFSNTGTGFAPIPAASINGTPLQRFDIRVGNLSQYDLPADTLRSFFSRYCGVTLPVKPLSDSSGTGSMIVLTSRKADGSLCDRFEKEIYCDGRAVYLAAANPTGAQQVIYTFLAMYFDRTGTAEISLPRDGTPVYHTAEMDWDSANPAILSVQERIVRGCYKLEEILEYDMAQGLYYTYQNQGYPATVEQARKTGNRTTNCVIVGNWVMKDAGFYADGIYNHKYGKDGAPAPAGYSFSGGSKAFFEKNFDIIDLTGRNRTIGSLTEKGEVLPGDIIGFRNHNQTVLPNGNAFDGGRNTLNMETAATGGKFLRWIGPNPYPTMTVDYIFRAKDAE